MGLPEGWTKYGADGEEIRPLQRYKALGNAIALPCADYIMAGIYVIMAMEDCGFSKKDIRRVVGQLYEVFDLNSVEDAKQKFHSSPY